MSRKNHSFTTNSVVKNSTGTIFSASEFTFYAMKYFALQKVNIENDDDFLSELLTMEKRHPKKTFDPLT